MATLFELRRHLDSVLSAFGGDLDTADVASVMTGWGSERLLEVMREADALLRGVQLVMTAATGAIAAKSTREHGHHGIAQKAGHRTTEALIQSVTGATRAEAARQVRVARSLVDSPSAAERATIETAGGVIAAAAPAAVVGWDAPVRRAYLQQRLSQAQNDAIRRGLGQPVIEPDVPGAANAARNAWSAACEHLIEEAAHITVEALFRASQVIRDALDPEGAARRYAHAHEARSLRMWRDADGVDHAKIRFEPYGAAEFRAIFDAALRPRKGGPRFVDVGERASAERLAADPRTNEQLAYDLALDLFEGGALSDAETVFGVRQAGVRVVAEKHVAFGFGDANGHSTIGLTEDGHSVLPGWLVQQRVCSTGAGEFAFDRTGDPLYVGREQRPFTAKQRIAMAIRDGGCVWHGCDTPASYCEAHHIDPWEHGGRTDVDRGILLCRYHHMNLHANGWKITRDRGTPRHKPGDFRLHPPPEHPIHRERGGEPVALTRRLALRYAFGDLNPKRRFLLAA